MRSNPVLGDLLATAMRRKHHDVTGEHLHITICFKPNDKINFYPEGDRKELAVRLRRVVDLLHDRPELIRCAAGACDGTCGHAELGTPS